MKNIIKILFYPFVLLRRYYLYHYLVRNSPEKYVKHLYKLYRGKSIDIDNPQDYNEWIQWTKFRSDTSQWARLSDKYRVREYIEECGLEGMLVPLYGVWDNVESINFDVLPDRFILKTNNGSGTNLIVKTKKGLDTIKTKELLNKWLNTKYGYRFAELHYLDIKPLIIAEQLLDCDKQCIKTNSLIDYKFFCANGEPICVLVIWDRFQDSFKCAVHDMNWNVLPNKIKYNSHYLEPNKLLPMPTSFNEMVSAVKILCRGFPQVRVDLYQVNDKPYFGEMTFTSAGGFMDYFTEDFLLYMGQKIKKNE